jgi:hypothetical protein
MSLYNHQDPRRNTTDTRSNTLVRSCVRSAAEHQEIEGYGDRIMGHIDWCNWNTISSWTENNRNSSDHHSQPISSRQLVASDRRNTSQGAWCVLQELSLDQRILYVHNFLLARAWYTAQIFQPPDDCIRQLNTAVFWYLWRGDIFRVPLSTFYQHKEHGGWELTHVAANSCALLLYRLGIQGQKTGLITAGWLKKWNLLKPCKNPPPPHREIISAKPEHLRVMEMETAYIAPQGQKE